MKHIMKSAVLAATAAILIACFSGCAASGTTSGNDNKTASKEETTMKMEDISWEVDEGILDGERYVLLGLTNNSPYIVTGFELTFKEKADITEEQKAAYIEDVKTMFGIDESDESKKTEMDKLKAEPIAMKVTAEKLIRPGEAVQNEKCTYYSGYYNVKNIDHYKLVAPDVATIKYIDKAKLYTLYYDFSSKKYSKDSKVENAQYWTTSGLETAIPKPSADLVMKDFLDDAENFSFNVYGWTAEQFKAYMGECKTAGYTVTPEESAYSYSAKTETGYEVRLRYDEEEGVMNATVSVTTKAE